MAEHGRFISDRRTILAATAALAGLAIAPRSLAQTAGLGTGGASSKIFQTTEIRTGKVMAPIAHIQD